MAVYFVVMLLPYQNWTEVLETIIQSALRRMWIVRNIPEYARNQLLARGATPWCSDSPEGDTPQYIFEAPCRNTGCFGI